MKKPYNNAVYRAPDVITQAENHARRWHGQQDQKEWYFSHGKICEQAYAEHPKRVAHIGKKLYKLMYGQEKKAPDDFIAALWLHDVVEDTEAASKASDQDHMTDVLGYGAETHRIMMHLTETDEKRGDLGYVAYVQKAFIDDLSDMDDQDRIPLQMAKLADNLDNISPRRFFGLLEKKGPVKAFENVLKRCETAILLCETLGFDDIQKNIQKYATALGGIRDAYEKGETTLEAVEKEVIYRFIYKNPTFLPCPTSSLQKLAFNR